MIESTSTLFDELKNIKSDEEFKKFRIEHPATDNHMTLSGYFNTFIAAHPELTPSKIVKNSDLKREYGLALLNGSKKNPSRDRVIALCIGAGMTPKEANRALRYADHALLSPKNDRDCVIIMALNKNTTSAIEVNLSLDEKGLELLELHK